MASPKLTDEQKARVAEWAAQGADLNVLQDRLKTEMGITLTFMETRFLISDLGVTLQSKKEDEKEEIPADDALAGRVAESPHDEPDVEFDEVLPPAGGASRVKLTVDEITLPGSMASGKVTFSDGIKASWSLDQMGRLGLSGVDRTYQPPEADVVAFQRELQKALQRL